MTFQEFQIPWLFYELNKFSYITWLFQAWNAISNSMSFYYLSTTVWILGLKEKGRGSKYITTTSWFPDRAIQSSTLNMTPLFSFLSLDVSSVSLSLLSLSRPRPSPGYLSLSRVAEGSWVTCSEERLGPVKSDTVMGDTSVQHLTVTVVYNLLGDGE